MLLYRPTATWNVFVFYDKMQNVVDRDLLRHACMTSRLCPRIDHKKLVIKPRVEFILII